MGGSWVYKRCAAHFIKLVFWGEGPGFINGGTAHFIKRWAHDTKDMGFMSMRGAIIPIPNKIVVPFEI